MIKLMKRVSKKVGLKPGSVVYVGKERTEEVNIRVIDYTKDELTEKTAMKAEDCLKYKDSPSITWIDVDGIHKVDIIENLGNLYNLHPLVLEDIVNSGQRPKMEDLGEYIFIVMKMLYFEKESGELKSEQVSVVFGDGWVMTFQETGEDVFDVVRHRIKNTVPRVRFMSADYLAYALLDAVVDNYFIVLETLGEKIENLEDAIAEHSSPKDLEIIRELKKQLIYMRKAIWPLREVIGGLDRAESRLIKESTTPYLRDLYEHTVQVIDTVETFRDMVSGLLDLYHTGISNRMNEIMKVLTIIATIFIPLGFLAGVYGMNFDTSISPFNLPELSYKYGYLVFWAAVLTIGGGMFLFFRKKRWL